MAKMIKLLMGYVTTTTLNKKDNVDSAAEYYDNKSKDTYYMNGISVEDGVVYKWFDIKTSYGV
eukprot:scaffold28291_cov37-Prasinocladus_malaysianus.AAC.1